MSESSDSENTSPGKDRERVKVGGLEYIGQNKSETLYEYHLNQFDQVMLESSLTSDDFRKL